MKKRQELVFLLENCANKSMVVGVIMHYSWGDNGSGHCMLQAVSRKAGWIGELFYKGS